MNLIYIVITGLLILISPLLCLSRKRKYVLFCFGFMGVISPILWGLTSDSGIALGGFNWSFLDFQYLCLLLIAWPLSIMCAKGKQDMLTQISMICLTCLILLNIMVGRIRLETFSGVLNVVRLFMSVPIYFVAANVFSDVSNVKEFYKWVMRFCVFLFILHLVIALKIYVPPLGLGLESRQEFIEYRTFLRSTVYIFESMYIIALSVAICHLMFKKTARFLPILTVFCASVGGIMTQTRSIYGGLFLVFLGLLGLVKGKARSFILIFTCVAMLGVGYSVAKMSGVDILYRFREGRLAGQAYVGTRSTEFQSLIDSIERAPLGLFTGQGFGVLHHPEAARNWRGYFHNDYYGTIFSLGIIGLIIFIYIISSSIIRGHSYRKIPEVAFVTMPPRLIMFSVAGMAVFNQQFWIYKGCGLLMLILAIASNVHNYSGQISAEKSLEEDNYLL